MGNKKKATGIPAVVTQPDNSVYDFTYDGHDYTVETSVFQDVEFHEAVDSGSDVAFVKALVGAAQFKKFKATGKNGKRNIDELREFVKAADDAFGVESGESEG
jgi:hypothetical protein